jgi:hypothetical protein
LAGHKVLVSLPKIVIHMDVEKGITEATDGIGGGFSN